MSLVIRVCLVLQRMIHRAVKRGKQLQIQQIQRRRRREILIVINVILKTASGPHVRRPSSQIPITFARLQRLPLARADRMPASIHRGRLAADMSALCVSLHRVCVCVCHVKATERGIVHEKQATPVLQWRSSHRRSAAFFLLHISPGVTKGHVCTATGQADRSVMKKKFSSRDTFVENGISFFAFVNRPRAVVIGGLCSKIQLNIPLKNMWITCEGVLF